MASERLMQKLEKLKMLRSHVHSNPTMEELLEDMADLLIKRLDPEWKLLRKKNPTSPTTIQPAALPGPALESISNSVPKTEIELHPGEVTSPDKGTSPSGITTRKTIPSAVKQVVWKRDQGACTYGDPHSGRKCESTHLLEFDHVIPWALGGGPTLLII